MQGEHLGWSESMRQTLNMRHWKEKSLRGWGAQEFPGRGAKQWNWCKEKEILGAIVMFRFCQFTEMQKEMNFLQGLALLASCKLNSLGVGFT